MIYRLNIIEKQGHKVVFHEKHRLEKAKKHPQLNDLTPNGFVKKKIPSTLIDPDYIYEDLTDCKIRNYYKVESYIDTPKVRIYFYTKVVVLVKWNPWVIISAYEPQYIKEEGSCKKCLYQKA